MTLAQDLLARAKPTRAREPHLCDICYCSIAPGDLYLRLNDRASHVECAEEKAGRRWGEDENQMILFKEEPK